VSLAESADFASIGVSVPMSEIYRNVEFEAIEPEADPSS
jgi:hypothetical protein